jgi:hypothetical protein
MRRDYLLTPLLLAVLAGVAGCPVGQRPGNGEVLLLQEPNTGGSYYLYLPEDYVHASETLTHRRWPLVVTFHGMKPFDTAASQIREWQQEADRYGYVVIAPACTSPNLLRQFPLRTVHKGVVRDEALTMGAMDDVARRVDIDPAKVLSTSWSSGGYLAHYMVNRHPERFSCIAPRQSNFSAAVLDPEMVERYRHTKVGIFYTQNDFAICRRESQEGARWYNQRGFDVTFAVFKDLGHQRRPSVSADFFAAQIGATAKTPPLELARMQVRSLPLPELAKADKRVATSFSAGDDGVAAAAEAAKPTGAKDASPRAEAADQGVANAGQPSASADTSQEKYGRRMRLNGPGQPTPLRGAGVRPRSSLYGQTDEAPLRVQVSSTMGIAPMHLNFRALVDADLRRGAFFLWTDNGEPISNGVNGQKHLSTPGKHVIEVLMTTADGREFRARRTITVLERVDHQSGG